MAHAQAVPNEEKHSGGSGVFIALVPWILFTVIAEHRTLQLASVAALALAVVICARSIRAGHPKSLELGTVAAFAAFTIVAYAADPTVGHWLERYARAIAAALLALIAFASLASVPFTEQYAREKVPPEAWSSPRFKSTNRRLTLLWGLVFAAMVPFHIAAGVIDTHITNLLFNWVVPIGLVLLAIRRTSAITAGAKA